MEVDKRKNLIFFQGAIDDDDGAWDVNFWQKLTPDARSIIATEMAVNYHRLNDSLNFKMEFDRLQIVSGPLQWYRDNSDNV